MKKKFSVGLTLETTIEEFESFLCKYHSYIYEFYFSLPLGDRFHSRKKVSDFFTLRENIDKFWRLLHIIEAYQINLELALNTYRLQKQDIINSVKLLVDHDIKISSIVTLEKYYKEISFIFTDVPITASYNNELRTTSDLSKIRNKYDYVVIGGAGIRNVDFWEKIKSEKSAKIKLLLNNGCSFNCKWCSNSKLCKITFEKNILKNSPLYLYALQSIMPFELYENREIFDKIDLFKISNRSDSLAYLESCLNSYLYNQNEILVKEDYSNYRLWCRLKWFNEFYYKFDYEKIIDYKKEINENFFENDLRER